MHYLEWGDPQNSKVIMCVHGLRRNAHDFDILAQALAAEYRVVCPDVVGRGLSDWLPASLAHSHYSYPQYLADMGHLISRLNATRIDYLGTSMGGLIGMLLAIMPAPSIKRLIINDVGPLLPLSGLQEIAQNGQAARDWPDLASANESYRQRYQSFGIVEEAHWQAFLAHSVRIDDAGVHLRDDPAISKVFSTITSDIDLWPIYDKITCPTLVIRGEHSSLLPPSVWREMAHRGPRAQLVEFTQAGHAPALMASAQVDLIKAYLRGEYRSVAQLPTV